MATIASLLAEHVRLRVRSVDRIFLHGYVPRLQTQGLLVRFLLDQGFPISSPALLGKIGRRYVAAVERFARNHGIPVVRFRKDDCKGGRRPRVLQGGRAQAPHGRRDARGGAGEDAGVAWLASRRLR